MMLRNLSEPEAGKILFDSFKKAINALTVQDNGTSRIEDRIRLRDTRPFRTETGPTCAPKKSLFSKIVGEPQPAASSWASRAFSTMRRMSSPSPRTTSPSASRSTT